MTTDLSVLTAIAVDLNQSRTRLQGLVRDIELELDSVRLELPAYVEFDFGTKPSVEVHTLEYGRLAGRWELLIDGKPYPSAPIMLQVSASYKIVSLVELLVNLAVSTTAGLQVAVTQLELHNTAEKVRRGRG